LICRNFLESQEGLFDFKEGVNKYYFKNLNGFETSLVEEKLKKYNIFGKIIAKVN
jgi:hypothetical protein